MRTLFLPLLLLMAVSYSGAENFQITDESFGCNGVDCDQLAMNAYNHALEDGENSHTASAIYSATLNGCVSAGGCSEQTLELQAP